MPTTKIGINAKAYRNTATYEAPTWSEIDLISDLTVGLTWDTADANARESRIKQNVKTLLGLEVTGKLKKRPLDANYEAFMNAIISDDILDLLILDGPNDEEGVRGWRIDSQITSGSEDQSLGNALYEDITIMPSLAEHNPLAVLVDSGGTLTYSTPGVDGGTFA
jgi:hypothetical protein